VHSHQPPTTNSQIAEKLWQTRSDLCCRVLAVSTCFLFGGRGIVAHSSTNGGDGGDNGRSVGGGGGGAGGVGSGGGGGGRGNVEAHAGAEEDVGKEGCVGTAASLVAAGAGAASDEWELWVKLRWREQLTIITGVE